MIKDGYTYEIKIWGPPPQTCLVD